MYPIDLLMVVHLFHYVQQHSLSHDFHELLVMMNIITSFLHVP